VGISAAAAAAAHFMQGVNEVASLMMRGDYVSVNTVLEDERPSHESITQVAAHSASLVSSFLSRCADVCVCSRAHWR
jgi:hypothetical protein